MRKVLSIVFISLITSAAWAQQFNGMSVSTGNMYPENSNFGVVLQNELIQVSEFDSVIKYDVVYEFKNNTTNFATVTAVLPINLYFNEFAPGKRAEMLDRLATIPTFNDLFGVQDKNLDTREQIRNNFQQRKFVRKYVSLDNLKSLGIYVDLFRNNTRVNVKKVWCEIKFTDATPLYLPKNTEVLSMEIRLIAEMNFAPDELSTILAFMTLPTVEAGINREESYAMYALGFEKNWSGRLEGLYLKHDMFQCAPILPVKMNEYTTYVSGERDQVLRFDDIMLTDNDKIAFYALGESNACNPGNQYADQAVVPSAIKSVTASSYLKTDLEMPKRLFHQTPMVAFSDSLHPYQTGNPTGVDVLNTALQQKMYDAAGYYGHVSSTCKSSSPIITLKESGHPLFAFDVSDHVYEDSTYDNRENFARQTCWCEGASGMGEKEWIEFEITQPSREMRMYNGNQSSKKVFTESSKADIITIASLDGHKINPNGENPTVFRSSIIDLTIMNVYELNMPPGKYRITIEAVDKGTVQNTCFSTIAFDFQVVDEWFMRSQSMLRSFFGMDK